MKWIVKILAVVFLTVAAFSCGSTRQLTVDQQYQLKEAIGNRDFKVDVNRAYPLSGRSINLTSPYALTVKGDSIKSYLPYFGRAYSIPYGGGEGLNFEGKINNYTVESGKKNATVITMDITSSDDRINYVVQIYPNGVASIYVTPQNRQAISFDGEVDLKD